MTDDYPELSGFEPNENYRPLRGKRFTTTVRVVVVLGLAALVVPGVLTTIRVASDTAAQSCASAVVRYDIYAVDFDARFELSGAGGVGWQCYSIDQNERERFLVPLGLIPSASTPTMPGIRS